jgi:hypothetical protein
MYGAMGSAVGTGSVVWVSKSAKEKGTVAKLGLHKRIEAVKHCRDVGKKDMRLNDALPHIKVHIRANRKCCGCSVCIGLCIVLREVLASESMDISLCHPRQICDTLICKCVHTRCAHALTGGS